MSKTVFAYFACWNCGTVNGQSVVVGRDVPVLGLLAGSEDAIRDTSPATGARLVDVICVHCGKLNVAMRAESPPAEGSPVPKGRMPSDLGDFYRDWAKQDAKDYLKNANAALAQLMTLSSALLGSSLVFWNDLPISPHFRAALVVLLLVNLGLTAHATMPTNDLVDVTSASDSERSITQRRKTRRGNVMWAQIRLFVILLLLAVAVGYSQLIAA